MTTAAVPPPYRPADVREWAAGNGWERVAGRNGRLPAAAIDAYVARHRPTPGAAELMPTATSETPGASVPGRVEALASSPEEQRDQPHRPPNPGERTLYGI